MQRIFVGVDGSIPSRRALHWAADLAGRGGLELVAVHVVGSGPSGAPIAERDAPRSGPAWDLEEWCATLPARCTRREAVIAEGDPGHALLDTAVHGLADLLVVASRGTGEVAGLHLGSVAHHLADQTTVPLAIVAPNAAVTTTRFVVGHDRRTGNEAALAFTAELAHCTGAPVTAVYSLDPRTRTDMALDAEQWHRQARSEVHAWAAPIEEAGVVVDCYIDHDRDVDPVAALEYALRDEPGAVAVVSVHGPGGRGGRRTPHHLVRRSRHAVILVPAPASSGRREDGPVRGPAEAMATTPGATVDDRATSAW